MNFLKRAWLRSTTYLAKTAVLVGLLTVICTMALSGLMISSAAAGAAGEAKASVGAVASLRFDLNAYLEAGKGVAQNGAAPGRIGDDANLYSGWADKIGNSDGVTGYNYQLPGANAPTNGAKPYSAVPRPPDDRSVFPDLITTTGVRDSDQLPDFREGRAKLLDGKPISPGLTGDQALVEERFAKANNLKTGGKFWLETGEIGQEKVKVEFEVAGIYRSDTASNPAGYTPPMNEPGNNIYLTIDSASRLEGKTPGPDGAKIKDATFTLADPDDLSKLQDAATAAGLDPQIFPLSLNDKRFQDLTGPITATAGVATLAVWLICAAGAVILALVIAAMVKERHTEMGILLAQGEPRRKLIGQLLAEVVACAVLAIGLAGMAAQFVSPAIGNMMLSGKVAAARAAANQPDRSNTSGGPAQQQDLIDKIDIKLEPADLLTVGVLGLGIAGIATVAPAGRVLRLRPRDILLKGN